MPTSASRTTSWSFSLHGPAPPGTRRFPMKVAAYQAPLLPGGSMAALQLIRDRGKWCETAGVAILCCLEAVLGGLADDAKCPVDIAIDVGSRQLEALPAPLARKAVTAVVGLSETS